MTEFIFVVRNGDLYNIGRNKSLEKVKAQLSPGTIVASLKTDDAVSILKLLQQNYSNKRIPESDYFRLNKGEFQECKRQLENGAKINDFLPFFTGSKLIITFLIAWVSISILIIKFGITPLFDQFS